MARDRFRLVEAIFQGALERGEESLESYLERTCGDQPEVLVEVRRMLAAHESARFALPTPLPTHLSTRAGLEVGAEVGDCTVKRLIGQGGMGQVYEAEQHKPRRRVALKLLSFGYQAGALASRFELEVEALGRLRHPGIAQIYGTGAVNLGHGEQPYFVMELVEGCSLRQYLVREAPDRNAILDLLVRICDAVEHAHERGVIHRDLKPENILVDATGQPRIVDFGIAKLSGDVDAGQHLQTRTGERVFTLAYAAPEQVSVRFGAPDARTDVYALGVITYEALTGVRPYETDRGLEESVRNVTQTDPPRDSLAAAGVPSDLAAVVRKAMAKQPDERYKSALDLGEDLARVRRGRPVAARRHSRLYLWKQILWQYRMPLALLTLVLAALVVTGTIATRSWKRTAEAAAALRQESARNEADGVRRLVRDGRVLGGREQAWKSVLSHVREVSEHGSDANDVDQIERDLVWALRSTFRSMPTLSAFQVPAPVWDLAAGDSDTIVAGDSSGGAWSLSVATGEAVYLASMFTGSVHAMVKTNQKTVAVGNDSDGRHCVRAWKVVGEAPVFDLCFNGPGDLAYLAQTPQRIWAFFGDEAIGLPTAGRAAIRQQLRRPLVGQGEALGLKDSDSVVLLYPDALVLRDMVSGQEVRHAIDRVAWSDVPAPTTGMIALHPERREVFWSGSAGRIRSTLFGETVSSPLNAETQDPVGAHLLALDAENELLFSTRATGGMGILDLETGAATFELMGAGRINMIDMVGPSRLLMAERYPAFSLLRVRETVSAPHVRRWPETPNTTWHSAVVDGSGHVVSVGAREQSDPSRRYDAILHAYADRRSPPRVVRRDHDTTVSHVGLVDRADGPDIILTVSHDGSVATGSENSSTALVRFDQELWALAIDPSGNRFAVGGEGGEVVVSTTATLEEITRLSTNVRVKALAFSPDGSRLLIGGNIGADRGLLEIWDLSAPEPRAIPFGDQARVRQRAVAWSHDGRLIAVGADDGSIRVLDGADGRLLHRIASAHPGRLFTLEFSPVDPTLLVSGAVSGDVTLWDARTGRELDRILEHDGGIFDVSFAPDGRSVLVAGSRSLLGLVDLTHYDQHIRGNLRYDLDQLGATAEEVAEVREWFERYTAREFRSRVN